MIKRIILPKPLRGLTASAGAWSLGWGVVRIIKDDLVVMGVTSMVLGAALLVLGLLSQEPDKGRSPSAEREDEP